MVFWQILADNLLGFDLLIFIAAGFNAVCYILARRHTLRLYRKLHMIIFVPSNRENPEALADAVRDLVRRGMSSVEPLYVAAIGAATNVASALLAEDLRQRYRRDHAAAQDGGEHVSRSHGRQLGRIAHEDQPCTFRQRFQLNAAGNIQLRFHTLLFRCLLRQTVQILYDFLLHRIQLV